MWPLLAGVVAASCAPEQLLAHGEAAFWALEGGAGWSGVEPYVASDTSPFSVQVVDAISGYGKMSKLKTIKEDAEYMYSVIQSFGGPAKNTPTFPVDLQASAVDTKRHVVLFSAVWYGYSDYAITFNFDEDSCKIVSMKKIWNDKYAMEAYDKSHPSSLAAVALSAPALLPAAAGVLFVGLAGLVLRFRAGRSAGPAQSFEPLLA
jgi:hypothetical protein